MRVPIVLLVAGAVTILAFQNCSQSGFQFVDQNAKLSANGQGPFVEDVVQLIEEEEQQAPAEEEVKQEEAIVEEPKEESQEVAEEVKEEEVKQEEVKQEEQQASEEVVQEEVKQEVADDKKDDMIVDAPVTNVGDNKSDDKKNDEPKGPVLSDELFETYSCGNGKGKGQEKKALVCHHPAGDVEKAHEICISKNALKAHLETHSHHEGHQDYLGPCVSQDE